MLILRPFIKNRHRFLTIDSSLNRSPMETGIPGKHRTSHFFPATRKIALRVLAAYSGRRMRVPIRLSLIKLFEINRAGDGETAALAAIAKFHPANGRAASTRRYTSVKVNRRVLLFAGLLCLRKLRIRATIIVTSVTYSPGLMAVTMAATTRPSGSPPPIAGVGTPRGEIAGGV